MKMAKATEKDIDSAGQAMSVLNSVCSGYYPDQDGEEEGTSPTFFDPDDFLHLRLFYDLMKSTLDGSPGWPVRVIGGMCFVILYEKNQIVDPDAETLEVHPRIAACLSACDGIDTDDLKSGSVSIVQKLHDAAAKQVLSQRDELLECFKLTRQALWDSLVDDDLRPFSEVCAEARNHSQILAADALIKRIEGGAA